MDDHGESTGTRPEGDARQAFLERAAHAVAAPASMILMFAAGARRFAVPGPSQFPE